MKTKVEWKNFDRHGKYYTAILLIDNKALVVGYALNLVLLPERPGWRFLPEDADVNQIFEEEGLIPWYGSEACFSLEEVKEKIEKFITSNLCKFAALAERRRHAGQGEGCLEEGRHN